MAAAALTTVRAASPETREARKLHISAAAEWQKYSADQSDNQARVNWWAHLGSPLLDTLIARGSANNYNAVMAARRIQIARAALGQTRAAYFPQIGLSASYNKLRQSGRTAGREGNAINLGYFDLGLNLSWEVDIFGKITSQAKASGAQVRVSRAEAAGVELSVSAEIATAYVTLRVDQAKLIVAQQHAGRQKRALDIAQARFEAGLASMMDVEQARENYFTTTASIPLLENNIRTDINSLGVLTADTSATLKQQLSVPDSLPRYQQLIRTGVPADLLRRRPDIVQAEQEIDYYAARLGIARKDWLPTLSLNAAIGTEAHNAGDLFGKESIYYSVVPTLSWTVFDGLSRKYGVTSARLGMENAIDNYNLTLQTAFAEVDNALSDYFSTLQYINSIQQSADAARHYSELSLDNYKSGLSPFINVADAQMGWLESVNSLIAAKGNALTALITLYKALGGGWTTE